MKSDRILKQVWRAKDALGKRFGYDVHRMAEHFRSPEEPSVAKPAVRKNSTKAKFRSSKSTAEPIVESRE